MKRINNIYLDAKDQAVWFSGCRDNIPGRISPRAQRGNRLVHWVRYTCPSCRKWTSLLPSFPAGNHRETQYIGSRFGMFSYKQKWFLECTSLVMQPSLLMSYRLNAHRSFSVTEPLSNTDKPITKSCKSNQKFNYQLSLNKSHGT